MVARVIRDDEAAGSSPASPTIRYNAAMIPEHQTKLTPEISQHILNLFRYAKLDAVFNEHDRLAFLGGKKITEQEYGLEIDLPAFAIFDEEYGWVASIDNMAQQLPPLNADSKDEIKYDDRDSISGIFDSPLAAAEFIYVTHLNWLALGLYSES